MKRPLMLVVPPFIAGILLANFISVPLNMLLATGISLAVLALIWSKARSVLLWPLILVAGWADYTVHTAILSPHDLRHVLREQPVLATLRGTLIETPTMRVFQQDEKELWHTQARINVSALRLDRQDWQPAVGRVAVTTPAPLTNIFGGQTVEIAGVLRFPDVAPAEGVFDYRAYLKQQGIYYQLQAQSEQDWQLVSSPALPPLSDRFRAWGQRALALGLPAEDESLRLEWALTLGWKTALTEEVSEPFIRAATLHIFAVDGLRMAIVFGILLGLLRTLTVPRAICGLVLLPWIWFYTALTGWPASAIRATVMLTVIIIGWVLKRPSDNMNSLLAAALILLIWEPREVFQAGFQLSFVVVLSLILILPLLKKVWQRLTATDPFLPERLRPRWQLFLLAPAAAIADVLLTSFAAWIAGLPLVARYFNILTPVSTPANLLAVPLCGLVLICNMSSLFLVAWLPAGAILFNHAGWFLMNCIRVTSHWFADWHWAYFYVPAPGCGTCALYYTILFATVTGWLFKPRFRAWKINGLAIAIGLWSFHCWHYCSSVRLHVLPLQGGMAVFFDGPGQKSDMLIDCGTTNAVARITKPFLRAQGVNRLSKLLLTHGDLRHVGGAEIIDDLYDLEHVCISPVRFRSPTYRRLVQHFTNNPTKLATVRENDSLGPWTVLHPAPTDRFPQADDNCLVLFGTFSGTRVLLLSDLGQPGASALLERHPSLSADIVVTGLPAQGEPVSDALLDALRPQLIIVADSEFPATERAREKLRDRLASRGVIAIYTRSTGAAMIELIPGGWSLRTTGGLIMANKDVRKQP